jgi:hypothetical protein
MHGRLREDKRKRGASFRENTIVVLGGVLAFVLAIAADNIGIPMKWVTAVLGTIITFGFVIYACRQMLKRWAFWTAISICLGAHIVATWVFFRYVLYRVDRFSFLFWYPIMLVEVFVLLIAVKRIHDKLTGKRETIKLSF